MKNRLINQVSVTATALRRGGVAVIATDTIYGLVGRALNKKTVERIYKIKRRSPQKPTIILISSLKELLLFEVSVSPVQKRKLRTLWPGKVSIILDCKSKKLRYLHRATDSLAFRLPNDKHLIRLLKKTGPLIAPSANPEGLPPAKNITEAKKYFGNTVDVYLPGKRHSKKPSTLIRLNKDASVVVLREGAVNVHQLEKLSKQ